MPCGRMFGLNGDRSVMYRPDPHVPEHFRSPLLVPFRVRSFRFQWPADLLTSWAFEMEVLILGWFILVETGSVLALTVFASLQFLGTLIAPIIGVYGDRLGRRTVLAVMRSMYLGLAATMMGLAFAGLLTAAHVFVIAFFAGLVRPSDLVMRNALIGDTMPAQHLMSAMGVSRTTMDSARIGGALIGAGLFSQFGIAMSYAVVAGFYAASLVLTFGVARGTARMSREADTTPGSPWSDLRRGLHHVWTTPIILAAMWLAFLVNLTIFPITHGILPYVAREVYMVDENGLGHLVASYAGGALVGSLVMSVFSGLRRPSRFMMVNIFLMFVVLFGFGQVETKLAGQAMLFLSGLLQSLAMIALVVTVLSVVGAAHRGLVMGVRMLAVYGLPLGLLGSGVLVDAIGYSGTVSLYSVVGLATSVAIAVRWRRAIWHGLRNES